MRIKKPGNYTEQKQLRDDIAQIKEDINKMKVDVEAIKNK